MVKIKFFTRARDAARVEGCSVKAAKVDELLEKLSKRFGKGLKRVLRGSEIFVNGLNVGGLKGYDTELRDEDVVWFVPASGGG